MEKVSRMYSFILIVKREYKTDEIIYIFSEEGKKWAYKI